MNQIIISGKVLQIKFKQDRNGETFCSAFVDDRASPKPVPLIMYGKSMRIAKNGIREGDTAMFIGELMFGKKNFFVYVSGIELYNFIQFERNVDRGELKDVEVEI